MQSAQFSLTLLRRSTTYAILAPVIVSRGSFVRRDLNSLQRIQRRGKIHHAQRRGRYAHRGQRLHPAGWRGHHPQTLALQRLQVIADRDSLDWKDYDADTICQRVTSRVQQGSIVLFHNAALHTPEALPAILTCLINDGYTVVPISQLILPPPYTIDHTGRQFAASSGQ